MNTERTATIETHMTRAMNWVRDPVENHADLMVAPTECNTPSAAKPFDIDALRACLAEHFQSHDAD